jgi:hypothetical protein
MQNIIKLQIEDKYDVIFIGAGPIGSWTSSQLQVLNLKLNESKLNICIFEKYKEKTRKREVIIDKTSLVWSVDDKEFKAIAKKLPGKTYICSMEKSLTEFAQNHGIDIFYETITDCDELRKRFPRAKVIVGSDGSNSIVRKQIFDDEFDVNFNMKYFVDVVYEIKGHGKSLSWLQWTITQNKLNKFFIKEKIKHLDNGNSKVTLRFFIDEQTYEQIKDHATIRAPADFDDVLLSKSETLHNAISIWLKAKKDNLNEEIIVNPKISCVYLDVYKTKEFYKIKDGVAYIVVGNSAFGVPFFRALNDGMLCGTILAYKILEFFRPSVDLYSWKIISLMNKGIRKFKRNVMNISVFDEYAQFANLLANYETIIAKIKNNTINVGIKSARISTKVCATSSNMIMDD